MRWVVACAGFVVRGVVLQAVCVGFLRIQKWFSFISSVLGFVIFTTFVLPSHVPVYVKVFPFHIALKSEAVQQLAFLQSGAERSSI